ncbi:EAL domain-containing protein [Granulicella arctica]|uniref:EAL domain-containing protein n=1 Tax=Granulicella arctica TaxID=940613 RepID=UPI0037C06F10
MHEEALTELQRKIQLRAAVEHHEFELYYQPLVKSKERTTYGVEALLRWHHPTRGLLEPIEFVELAEEMGLIVPYWSVGPSPGMLRSRSSSIGTRR